MFKAILKKLIFLSNILIGFLFLIPFVPINLVFRTKFLTLKTHRFGHFVEDYFLFSHLNDKKSLKFLSFYSSDGNKYLKKVVKKNNLLLPSFIGSRIYLFLTTFNKIFKILNHFIAYEKIHKKSNYEFIVRNRQLDIFDINLIQDHKYFDFLKKNNPENKKIISVNISAMEHLQKFKKKNWSHHDVRKSDINKYKEFFKFLIKKNYLLLRMGHSNEALIFNDDYYDKNFINYSTYNRDDTLDFYLMSKSYMYITSCSGLDHLAFALNIPMIINTPIINHFFTENNNTLYLLKRFYCEDQMKFMKVDEIFKRFIFKDKKDQFINSKLIVKDNTTDELINAYEDLNYLIKNNFKLNNEIENFNINVWKKYIKYNNTITKNYFINNKIKSLFSWSNNKIL